MPFKVSSSKQIVLWNQEDHSNSHIVIITRLYAATLMIFPFKYCTFKLVHTKSCNMCVFEVEAAGG